jgi:hypothetical protein
MRWSKLKQMVESRMADSLDGRVELHATTYTKADDAEGRGWITVDKVEIANFCDYTQRVRLYDALGPVYTVTEYSEKLDSLWSNGVLSRLDFYASLKELLSLSVEDALTSDNVLIRALSMTDRRLGKRRLRALQADHDDHHLVHILYALRCEVEGIQTPSSASTA